MSSASESFPCDGTLERIRGPAGALEVLLSCPAPEQARPASAVICHPHPLYGGTMQNKVVHTVARAYSDLGLRTVRFNFRGVGSSDGAFDHGAGETADVMAVIDWLARARPRDSLFLAGFSFGAYVALRAAAQRRPAHLLSIAPPVHMYDFAALPHPQCPWWVIQGEADEVVDAQAVTAWAATLDPAPQLVRLPGVSHFFHQRLNDLRQVATQALKAQLPAVRSEV